MGGSGHTLSAAQAAPVLLGSRCYVNWPYLQVQWGLYCLENSQGLTHKSYGNYKNRH